MSWFRSNNTGGHNKGGGELGHVHRPVIIGPNGMMHPLLGYESHNSEQYMARTEKVVKYRRFPGMAGETEEYGAGDLSGRKNEFSSNSVRRPIKDLPRDNGFRFDSSPPKDHHRTTHGYKSGNLDSNTDYTNDEDDDNHHDVRVNNTKGTRTNNMKEQEYYNHDERNRRYLRDQDYHERVSPKTNGYSPPKYTVPMSTHQDREKGNDYAVKDRKSLFGTPPRNETSHETSNFKPIVNILPQFNPQPKKEMGAYNQETIDSTEASRRYGMGATGAGAGARLGVYAEDKHSGGTLNSKEAARKYNGVLLTN